MKILSKRMVLYFDDFSELLNQLVLEKDPDGHTTTPKDYSTAMELFQVDLTYLDPTIELKRKVGGVELERESMHSELPDLPPAIANKVASKLKKTTRRHKKQLIAPRSVWTKVTSALVELSLERIPHHVMYGSAAFRLLPNEQYKKQFEEFVLLVEMADIESIYAFARKHPLHVDALLVVSDYLRMTSTADASELTERALYILEKCCLATEEKGVDLTAGLLRLPYEEFDNRRMHLALIRYIQFLAKKGCYRTALEFCKILWSLDPLIDPLASRMISDFVVVQAGHWSWFELVYQEICLESPWLSNWHFSNALQQYIRGNRMAASICLQNAIMESPWMIPKLADACGLQIDEESWQNSFSYTSSDDPDHIAPLRNAIAKIYAQRSGPMWKSQKVKHEHISLINHVELFLARREYRRCFV